MNESSSEKILRQGGIGAGVIVWFLTSLEILSALARKRRAGDISAAIHIEAIRRLDDLRADWTEIHSFPQVREKAERLINVHPLRAADSLQLSAALVAADGNPKLLELVTLDANLAEAATREGFRVWPME